VIKNAECFARIDVDRSRFEKENNHYVLVVYVLNDDKL